MEMSTLAAQLGSDPLSKFVLTLHEELTRVHDESRSAYHKLSQRCDELEARLARCKGIDIPLLWKELSTGPIEPYDTLRDAFRGTWVETLLLCLVQTTSRNVVVMGPAGSGKSFVCYIVAAASSQVQVVDGDARLSPQPTTRCRITMTRGPGITFPDAIVEAERLPDVNGVSVAAVNQSKTESRIECTCEL